VSEENNDVKIASIIVLGVVTLFISIQTSCAINNKTRAKLCIELLNSSAADTVKAQVVQSNNCRVN